MAKSVLIPLGLTAAASAAENMLCSAIATLIILNNEMEDIMKVVTSLEDSNLLFKKVSQTIQNEAKEQKGGLLSMLLGT